MIAFLPHLTWNYQQDWVSFRFQFGRGLKSEYVVSGAEKVALPRAEEASPESREFLLGSAFDEPKKIKPKKEKSAFQKGFERSSNYFGGQLMLWGLMIIPIGAAVFRRKWQNSEVKDSSLLWAGIVVPVGLFALLSPFQKVEANWAAVYTISAAALLATWKFSYRGALITAGGNLLLVGLVLLHAYSPLTTKKPSKDRILKETHGFDSLATKLDTLDRPIFGDTYQNISILSFYNPELKISQWPGIARMSEISRRNEMIYHSLDHLKENGGFYLVTNNQIPPQIPGFAIQSFQHYRDCLGQLQVFEAPTEGFLDQACKKPVHRWYLARYDWDSGVSSTSSM